MFALEAFLPREDSQAVQDNAAHNMQGVSKNEEVHAMADDVDFSACFEVNQTIKAALMDGLDVMNDSFDAWPSAGLMDSDAFVQSFSFNPNKKVDADFAKKVDVWANADYSKRSDAFSEVFSSSAESSPGEPESRVLLYMHGGSVGSSDSSKLELDHDESNESVQCVAVHDDKKELEAWRDAWRSGSFNLPPNGSFNQPNGSFNQISSPQYNPPHLYLTMGKGVTAFAEAVAGTTPSPQVAPAVPPTQAPPFGKGPTRSNLQELEKQATDIIAGFLSDPAINPYMGSVPLERIQNIFRCRHSELYDQVVGTKHSAWKKYVQRNAEVFAQFSVEEGKWRMRLQSHTDWEKGDLKEEKAKTAWENHLTETLTRYLESLPVRSSSLDSFKDAYPQLVEQQLQAGMDVKHYTLPHRGDLVRFIRRSDVFSYDQSSYLIGFKQDTEKAEKEEDKGDRATGDLEAEVVGAKMEKTEVTKPKAAEPKQESKPPKAKTPKTPPSGTSSGSADSGFFDPPAGPVQVSTSTSGNIKVAPVTPKLQPAAHPQATKLPSPINGPKNAPSPPALPHDQGLNGPRSLPPGHTPEREAQATQIIVDYLTDPCTNPYQGSVPVERIQNIFRGRYGELYDTVVGNKHSAWKRYIERNAGVFTYFPIEEGKWRMRLLSHHEWEKGDRAEEAARDAWDSHLTKALTAYLASMPDKTSSLDEFMAAYPNLSEVTKASDAPQYTLPHRGDLVRFIRRSNTFSYDTHTFCIGFKPPHGLPKDKPEAKEASAESPGGPNRGLNPNAPAFHPRTQAHY